MPKGAKVVEIVEDKPVGKNHERNVKRREKRKVKLRASKGPGEASSGTGTSSASRTGGRNPTAFNVPGLTKRVSGPNLRFGLTEHGCSYTRNFLHPADPVPGLTGYPDESANPQAMVSYNQAYQIEYPGTDYIDESETWNIQMIKLPNDAQSIVMVAWAASTPSPPTQVWSFVFGSYGADGYAIDYQSHGRWNYVTVGEHKYAVRWQGVTGIDFVNNSDGQVNGTVSRILQFADKWRPITSGLTVHLDAATLTDQGKLYAGQVSCDNSQESVTLLEAVGEPPENKPYTQNYNKVDFPLTYAELTQDDHLGLVTEARKGVYVPIRISDKENPYVPTSYNLANTSATGGRWTFEDSVGTGMLRLGPWLNKSGQVTAVTNGQGLSIPSSLSGHLMAAVVIFAGIHKTSSLNMRSYGSLSVTCDRESPYAVFIQGAPVVDEQALRAAAMLSQHMPHAFPAEFNDLGKLWGVIKDVVKIVPGVADVLGGMGIPVVSDIANVVGGVAKMFV